MLLYCIILDFSIWVLGGDIENGISSAQQHEHVEVDRQQESGSGTVVIKPLGSKHRKKCRTKKNVLFKFMSRFMHYCGF